MTAHMQGEALRALAEVWALSPDMRLGQLVAFLGFLGEDQFGRGLGDIEDDELVAVLYRHKADLVAHASNQPSIVSAASGSATVAQPAPLHAP
jgi:hypothetical protein